MFLLIQTPSQTQTLYPIQVHCYSFSALFPTCFCCFQHLCAVLPRLPKSGSGAWTMSCALAGGGNFPLWKPLFAIEVPHDAPPQLLYIIRHSTSAPAKNMNNSSFMYKLLSETFASRTIGSVSTSLCLVCFRIFTCQVC